MSWAMLVQLIVQFGPRAWDLASTLIAKWNSPDLVTQADIDQLRAMGAVTPRQMMLDALQRAGLSVDSPQAVALLALVP